MATGNTVITASTGETPAVGSVFKGLKFFVLRQVPARTQLVADIEANGGRVLKNENDADFFIADHLRSNAPGGSFSYTLIEAAIKDGAMPSGEGIAVHATGQRPAAQRPVGSSIPQKSTRTPFTAGDDRILLDWVAQEEAKGQPIMGNEIYKRLAALHPQHTNQSWRDRYVKHLRGKPLPAGVRVLVATTAPPSPPSDAHDEFKNFDQGDFDLLMSNADDVELVADENQEKAWQAWSRVFKQHSADEWRRYYHQRVKPEYLRHHETDQSEELEARHQDKPVQEMSGNESEPRDRRASGGSTTGEASKRKRESQGFPSLVSPRKRRAVSTEAASVPRNLIETHQRVSQGSMAPQEEESARTTVRKAQDVESYPDKACEVMESHSPALVPSLVEASHHHIQYWLPEEDRVILKGMQRGWSSTMIISHLPRPETRTAGAVRARRKILKRDQHLETADAESSGVVGAPAARAQIEDNFGSNATAAFQIQFGDKDSSTRSDLRSTLEHSEAVEHSSSRLVTSDANQAADEQLLSEAVQQASRHLTDLLELQEPSAQMESGAHGPIRKMSTVLQLYEGIDPYRDGEQQRSPSPTPGKAFHVVGMEGLASQVLALTEANLATQQEQQKLKMPRGADIEEDDPRKDQTEYVSYLQNLINPYKAEQGTGTQRDGRDFGAAINSATGPADSLEAPSHTVLTQLEDMDHDRHQTHLHLSSDDEIVDAVNDAIKWPASPQQHRSHVETQSQRFETQVNWPKLSKVSTMELVEPRGLFGSMLKRHPGGLGISNQQSADAELDLLLERESGRTLGDAVEHVQPSHQPIGDIDETNEDSIAQPNEDDWSTFMDEEEEFQVDDADLTIVEPDGGFDDFASPEKTHSWPAVDPLSQVSGPSQEHTRQETFGHEDTIELSSANPTSSPYQSPQHSQWLEEDGLAASFPVDTQDIMNAETQNVDLFMPMPPSSDGDVEDSEEEGKRPESKGRSPAYQAHEVSHADEEEEEEEEEDGGDVDSWVQVMVVRGFNESSVINALKCTSLRPELARLVLYADKACNGMPDDVPGIWSQREDAWLEGSDARVLRRLEDKHGSRECNARMKFLQQYRDVYV